MQLIPTQESGAVGVMSVWELQFITYAFEDWMDGTGSDSRLGAAMLDTLRAAAAESEIAPCICGDLHPAEDCGLGEVN